MSLLESENTNLNEQLEEIKNKNISLEVQVQEIPQLKLKVSLLAYYSILVQVNICLKWLNYNSLVSNFICLKTK